MAVATGQRHVGNVAATQRVIDLKKDILLLEPDVAPIAVFTKSYLNGSMRERAKDPKITWHNDELETRVDAVNDSDGMTSGDTAMVVDNVARFAVDDLVKIPRTGEVVLVTALPGSDTLTITRGAGSSTAAAILNNEPIYIIGTAAEEGSRSQVARHENPVVETNYLQIFKHSVEASGTWLSSSNESSPHDFPHQKRKAMIEHLKDIEGAFLFGAPGEETGANGKKQRLTGGLLYYLTSNNVAAGGAWTLGEVNTFIRTITRYGSKHKVLFVSRLIAGVLDDHTLGKVQTNTGDTVFGVKVNTWQTNLGDVKIVVHDLLDDAGYTGTGIAVDFKSQALKYRYLNGDGPGGARDTHVKTNRQEEDRDGLKDEIITECGLQVGLPETGGVVTGVTGSA